MRKRRAGLLLGVAVAVALSLTGCGGAKPADGTTTSTQQDGLKVGTKAPDFRLKNQNQETVALSDYLGTKNVILVFYPADFTPV